MCKIVHVIPVSDEVSKVTESVRNCGMPITSVALLLTKSSDAKVAEELRKVFSVLADVREIYVEEDFVSPALETINLAKKGFKPVIHVTNAPPVVALSLYTAAHLTRSLYVLDGRVIPLPPPKNLGRDRTRILKKLYENGGYVGSVTKLVDLIEGLDEKRYYAQRNRVKYHLFLLEKDGLIKMEKVGRYLEISLTDTGKLYAHL